MTVKTVTFAHPFLLSGSGAALPAGSYEVIVEEEFLEGLIFESYRRVESYLKVDSRCGSSGFPEMRVIDLQDLDAALTRDRAHPHSSNPGDAR